jgi:hypothetical protein
MADIDDSLHLPPHLFEQYLTFSQFLAHFFRHSNSNLQVTQTFGLKPFLIFARMGLMLWAKTQ